MENWKPEIPEVLKSLNGDDKKNNDFNLSVRSEEVQEIIGRPPHWLVRGGIAMFLAVLGIIFIAASFIQYPEVIKTSLTLTALNAPKTLESKINGKLEKLIFENKTEVEAGQIVGWLESTAKHQSVVELGEQLDSLQKWLISGDIRSIKESNIIDAEYLGELQSSFQIFEQAYREFLLFLPNQYYSERKNILKQELAYSDKLLSNLEEQRRIQERNYELALQEFEAQQKLADKELIAKLDLLKSESSLSNQQLPLQQIESSIINNRLSNIAKQKEMLELDRQIKSQKSIFNQALNSMQSSVEEWKSKYLLITPVSGTVTYAGAIQEQQTMQAGQKVLYIEPQNTQFFGEIHLSQNSFGKIIVGQQVTVRFTGYPYHEFGSVTGVIEYLSEFPIEDSLFFAKVHFPNGLKTSYGKTLTPANGMKGEAEIITKNMRLLKRVYNNLTKDLLN